MRAREFITEREKLDEIVPLVVGAIWVAGLGWTAYDTYKNIQKYRKGEISGAELAGEVGSDVATAVVGGVVGKAIGKVAKVGSSIAKKIVGGPKAIAQATSKARADDIASSLRTGTPMKSVKSPTTGSYKSTTPTGTKPKPSTAAAIGSTTAVGTKKIAKDIATGIKKNPGMTGVAAANIADFATDGGVKDIAKDIWDKIDSVDPAATDADKYVYLGKGDPSKNVKDLNISPDVGYEKKPNKKDDK